MKEINYAEMIRDERALHNAIKDQNERVREHYKAEVRLNNVMGIKAWSAKRYDLEARLELLHLMLV